MSTSQGFWNWVWHGKRTPKSLAQSQQAVPASGAIVGPRVVMVSAIPYIPLAEAVADFNQRAAQDVLGRSQPLLTVDEVTTAIRSAGRHQLPLADHQRRQIHSIAESQQLPHDARLKFTTSWLAPSGYHCEVWWIDLVLTCSGAAAGAQQTASCSLRIRDHRLRSWHDPSVTVPTEIQRLQADHRWFPAGPSRTEVSTLP